MNDFLHPSHTLRNQLEFALKACGLPISINPEQIRPLHQGTDDCTYAVRVVANKPGFIVRIHNQPSTDPTQLHAHYMAQSLYYRLASHVQEGVCPSVYNYCVTPELACSIESELIKIPANQMSERHWHEVGKRLGAFIGQMNQKSAHLKGMGTLSWDGAKLFGLEPLQLTRMTDRTPYDYALEKILTVYPHHKVVLSQTLETILPLREVEEAVVLVNGGNGVIFPQLHPRTRIGVGIHSPEPRLGNGHQYAAWDVYRLLYEQLTPYADTVVRGFISTYPDKLLLLAELWLWFLLALAKEINRQGSHHESPTIAHVLSISLDIHRSLL